MRRNDSLYTGTSDTHGPAHCYTGATAPWPVACHARRQTTQPPCLTQAHAVELSNIGRRVSHQFLKLQGRMEKDDRTASGLSGSKRAGRCIRAGSPRGFKFLGKRHFSTPERAHGHGYNAPPAVR